MRNRCVVAAGVAAVGLGVSFPASAATLSAGEPIAVAPLGGNVRVALSDGGDLALVVWEVLGEEGTTEVLGARVRLSTREVLDATPIAIAANASQPDVAGADGTFAITWREGGDVMAAALDAADGVRGDAHVVGALRAEDERPSIDAFGGGWVVAWHSFEWDSPDAAIVARVLAADASASAEPIELEATSAPFVGVDVASDVDGNPLLGYLREASARLRVGLDGSTEVFGSTVRLMEIAAGASASFTGAAWIEDDLDAPATPWRLVMASTAAGSTVPATLVASEQPITTVRLAPFDAAAFALAGVSRDADLELRAYDLATGEESVVLTGTADADTDTLGAGGAIAFARDGVFVSAMNAVSSDGGATVPAAGDGAARGAGCSVTGLRSSPLSVLLLGLASLLAICVGRTVRAR